MCKQHPKPMPHRCRQCDNNYRKLYRRTKKGFLQRLYNNMRDRVTGVQGKKARSYVGKPIMSREDFYEWADCPEFYALYEAWVASDYNYHLTPSVNRLDHSGGYVLGNIEWMTTIENTRLGSKSRVTV